MKRPVLVVAVAALALFGGTAAFRLSTASGDGAAPLNARVGPDYIISFTMPDGSPITTLAPGTYTINAVDTEVEHNFHIFGPGVDLSTGANSEEEDVWTATFQNNALYTFRCDIHPTVLNGSVTVGSPVIAPVVAAPAAKSAVSAKGTGNGSSALTVAGTLSASVSATGALKLSLNGAAVKSLPVGFYKVNVTDASKTDNFVLRDKSAGYSQTLTATTFVGKKSASLEIAAGAWDYFSNGHPATHTSFVAK
ncbi:MAG: hypothetical protein F2663_09785 [Actinobacteria bacterium]|uniref:Unannotated protein n=1 Tax=freshwater metagenome TaxID=449393 RepID=A0A6J6QFZ5_9ZZZZ|nr:hypothetical protein [Actinomycetota bacterium]